MALSEIHCIGKNWLLERYPHKHRKHDRHIFFCFLGFSVLFFKYFVLLEDVSIFRVSDFSSRLSFKCAQMCNFFFLYDTRRNPLSAPHPSILSHSLALTHCCGGRGAWKDLDALFRFFGNLLGSASLPAGFLFAGPDLGTLQRIACTGIACMLLLSGVAWLPLFATKLLAQCSSNSMFSVDFGSNPSVIWCRFIFRLIAFAPGAAT